MAWKTLDVVQIDDFKRLWPCHGLPYDFESLACEFAANGDLIDLEARDSDGNILDNHDFDGTALRCLTDDCQRYGQITA